MDTMKLTLILMACLLIGGVALSVHAGAINDDEQGYETTRIQLRGFNDLLRVHAGRRHGQ